MSYAVRTDRRGAHGFVRDAMGDIARFPHFFQARDCAHRQTLRYPTSVFLAVDAPRADPWDAVLARRARRGAA